MRTGEEATWPDWVIIGLLLQGRHVVWASRELDQVELEAVYEEDDPWRWGHWEHWPIPKLRHIELRGRLRSYVMVMGSSYADCLTRLGDFGEPGEWHDPGPRPELAAPRELGAGTPALEEGG